MVKRPSPSMQGSVYGQGQQQPFVVQGSPMQPQQQQQPQYGGTNMSWNSAQPQGRPFQQPQYGGLFGGGQPQPQSNPRLEWLQQRQQQWQQPNNGYSQQWNQGVNQLEQNGVIPLNTGQVRPQPQPNLQPFHPAPNPQPQLPQGGMMGNLGGLFGNMLQPRQPPQAVPFNGPWMNMRGLFG
jgi:hypothetical protein